MTFDEWWKQTKPAECDELKQVFEECWENSAVWCADVCDEQSKRLQPPGNGKMYKAAQSCRREIFKRLDAWIGVRSNAKVSRSAPLLAQVGSTDGFDITGHGEKT